MSSESGNRHADDSPPPDDRTILSQGPISPGPGAGPALPNIPGISLLGEIARGGMGVVYRGRQEYIDREVAVKVLAAQLEGEQFTARFQREAKILAGINHPHIVACHQAGLTEDGRCYLAMEFVGGQNLQEWLDARGCMSVRSALRVTVSLATALAHAHEQGIIHRDIKAANVLMDGTTTVGMDPEFPFRPKLADLGLAKFTHGAAGGGDLMVTSPGTVMGTPSTMSPEQFDDPDNVDFRTDVYGLGCILHRALVGTAAFGQGSMTDIIVAKRERLGPNPSEANKAIPGQVGELVSRMLACDREERPASYPELIAELERLIQSTPEGTKLCDPGSVVSAESAPSTETPDERLLRTAELNFLIEADADGGTAVAQPENPDSAAFVTKIAPGHSEIPLGATTPQPTLRPAPSELEAVGPNKKSKAGIVAIVTGVLAVSGGAWWWSQAGKATEDPGSSPGGSEVNPAGSTTPGNGTTTPQAVANRAPVGTFDLPASVQVGVDVSLRAAVRDPDGDSVEATWRQVGTGVQVRFASRDGVTTQVRILDALPGESAVFELTLRDGVTPPVVIVERVGVELPPAQRLFGDSRDTALANWTGPEADSVSRWTPTESADISGMAREGSSFRTTPLPSGLWRASGVFHPQKMWSAEGDVFPESTGVRLRFAGTAIGAESGKTLAMCMRRDGDAWSLELCSARPTTDGAWTYQTLEPRMVVEWTDAENAQPGFFEFTKRSGELVCAFGAVGGVAKKTTLDCANSAGETQLSMFVDGGRALFRDFLLR